MITVEWVKQKSRKVSHKEILEVEVPIKNMFKGNMEAIFSNKRK
jgi:hypothetical protein